MKTVSCLVLFVVLIMSATAVPAQTTVFTYQGRLNDGIAPANGTYQMQFGLYPGLTGGGQIGSTITNNSVPVLNGVFTVQLDFGSSPFYGRRRSLVGDRGQKGERPARLYDT